MKIQLSYMTEGSDFPYTAVQPVPNYAAWWQRHMCVNNLPRVVIW